jgi:hypothetical protein
MPNLRSMHAAFMKVQAIPLAAFLLTLSTASLFGKEKNHVPLPAQVITAKTVYIDNQSEEADVGEKARDELRKWGRFQIVSDRAEADLILVFSTSAYTSYATSSPPYSTEVEANYTVPNHHRWQIGPAPMERRSEMGEPLQRLSQRDTRATKRLEETSRGTSR